MKVAAEFGQVAGALGTGGETALTIGVFDGLHLGHQALVREVVRAAKQRSLASLVVTFRDHPLSVLAPPYSPKKLIYPERKEQILRTLGVDILAQIEFTESFSQQTPEDFVHNIVVDACRSRVVVCGYDFSFGRSGSGDTTLLQRLGEKLGFEVTIMEAVTEHAANVKSTTIRDTLYAGRVAEAARLLSRPYELRGTVVSGLGRGRQLGFPTANLDVSPAYVLPGRGVYLCAAHVEGEIGVHGAMVNIGYNPTFGADRLCIEAHLFEVDADLRGKTIWLYFLRRLRDERKFGSVEALCSQLQQDREESLRLLGSGRMRPQLRKLAQET